MDKKQIHQEAQRLAAAMMGHHLEIRALPNERIEEHIDIWSRIAATACEIDPRCRALFADPDKAGARIAGYLSGMRAERQRQQEVARRG